MQPSKHTGYRFDSFEVHLQSGALLHKNHPIRLQRLPYRMLLILLERPGELVSREDLCSQLWNRETFVDFDNSLYVAAAKLREALGDDPATPRYIKTVSRLGYQFVADVTAVEAVSGLSQGQSVEAAAARAEGMLGIPQETKSETNFLPPPVTETTYGSRPGSSFFSIRMIAAGLAVAAVLGFLVLRYLNRPLASNNDKVLLGDVRNNTGDPSLDDVFSSALQFKLQESPFLTFVDDMQFRRQSLMDNGGQRTRETSLRDGLEACNTLGAQLFLTGQIMNRASGYRVEVDVWRCRDGKLLAAKTAEAASQSEILMALETATLGVRRRLGESRDSLEKFNAPLVQATTSSLAALKAFTKGETDRLQGKTSDAATNYKLAVDLDPQFALAYARLGSISNDAQEGTLGRQYFQKAFELRERTTDREKLYIAAHYYSDVLGDMPRGIDAYQLWESLYPRDVIPVENLGNIFDRLGEAEKALALERKAVQMRPDGTIRYALLASAEFEAGHYAELNTLCHDPKYLDASEVLLHYHCYLLAYQNGDAQSMQQQLDWGRGKKQESVLLEFVAWAEMGSGRLASARRTFAAARKSAIQNNLIDFSAELDLDEARLDADLGFAMEARVLTLEALRSAPARLDLKAFAALVLAEARETTQADAVIAGVSAETQRTTALMTNVLTLTRALEQLDRHNPSTAVQLLERSRAMDNVTNLALAPGYYRGLAYLDCHRYSDAAREFQNVLDHRTLMPESLYVPLSLLQLGHALQLAGHHEEALKSFHALDKTWQNADPDFPALRQLKTFENYPASGSTGTRRHSSGPWPHVQGS